MVGRGEGKKGEGTGYGRRRRPQKIPNRARAGGAQYVLGKSNGVFVSWGEHCMGARSVYMRPRFPQVPVTLADGRYLHARPAVPT